MRRIIRSLLDVSRKHEWLLRCSVRLFWTHGKTYVEYVLFVLRINY